MRRMLIVEDEPDISSCLQDYFSSRGFSVSIAFSGEQALDCLIHACSEPEVVLLDVILPGISGLEVLKRVKDLYPEARVIMVSGLTDPEVREEARSYGASDYVAKPFDFSDRTWSTAFCSAETAGL